MNISGLNTVSSADNNLYGSEASKSNALGKDDFLNLLVTQLQYQDPLNPMDSTEFTAQLAQFSSLEQLSNVNENLETMLLYQASINNAQSLAFIGKNIVAAGNEVELKEGSSDELSFKLAEDATSVSINISDSTGSIVKTLKIGAMEAGEQSIKWDGTDDQKNELDDGTYTFEVFATDGNGDAVNVETYTTSRITGILFRDGITYLLAGEKEIPIGNVVRIIEDETEDEEDPVPTIVGKTQDENIID